MNSHLKYIFSSLLICASLTPNILSAKTLSDRLSDIAVYVFAVPTGYDADEAAEIYKYVLSKHNFTVESKLKPGTPAFGCRPGSKGLFGTNPHIVTAWGITDEAEQDLIASIIREYKSNHKGTYPVVIEFYKEENRNFWVSADGKSWGSSPGPQELIRKVTIK